MIIDHDNVSDSIFTKPYKRKDGVEVRAVLYRNDPTIFKMDIFVPEGVPVVVRSDYVTTMICQNNTIVLKVDGRGSFAKIKIETRASGLVKL